MLILEILSMINIIVEGQILSTYFGFSFVRMSSTSFKLSRGIKLYWEGLVLYGGRYKSLVDLAVGDFRGNINSVGGTGSSALEAGRQFWEEPLKEEDDSEGIDLLVLAPENDGSRFVAAFIDITDVDELETRLDFAASGVTVTVESPFTYKARGIKGVFWLLIIFLGTSREVRNCGGLPFLEFWTSGIEVLGYNEDAWLSNFKTSLSVVDGRDTRPSDSGAFLATEDGRDKGPSDSGAFLAAVDGRDTGSSDSGAFLAAEDGRDTGPSDSGAFLAAVDGTGDGLLDLKVFLTVLGACASSRLGFLTERRIDLMLEIKSVEFELSVLWGLDSSLYSESSKLVLGWRRDLRDLSICRRGISGE